MCNLYSLIKGQAAIRQIFDGMTDRTGNLKLLPAIFPNTSAPVIRTTPEGREFTRMRWGMPSPKFALKNRKTDPAPPTSATLGRRSRGASPPPRSGRTSPRRPARRTSMVAGRSSKYSKAKVRAEGLRPADIAIPIHGCKSHISIDRMHGLIRRQVVTDAARHDGAQLREG